jgi:lysine N6-hydroxylase
MVVYKCLGVGVGPANLSLASLLHRHATVPHLFVDKKEKFTWHDGQQIPGSALQVSLFKDLVSLTDPTNQFSFISYLHARGKLYHFLNAQFDNVPRQEFRNYLEWASERNSNVTFGEEVLSIDFAERFRVRTSVRMLAADNIVIGIGNAPHVPSGAESKLGPTQFHVSEFVQKAANLAGKSVVVVGGGQSGAEAFLDLVSRPSRELPKDVAWVSRRRNYFPIDDSPFTNDYFMPCYSDYFYRLDPKTRNAFLTDTVLASDGISEATLRAIYQSIYMHRFVNGTPDLVALYPNRTVTRVEGSPNRWELVLQHNDNPDTVHVRKADVVVWATGFRPARMEFLAPIAKRLQMADGEHCIDENFAVLWDGPADRQIFMQNAARKQRGLADPNLSLVAWRSQRILDRVLGSRSRPQLPSFIQWGGSWGELAGELQGA